MQYVKKSIYRKVVSTLLFLTCCFVAPVAVKAEVVMEEREVGYFHSVDLRTVANISLTQGDNQSLVIKADRDVLGKLKTEVRDGRLIISSRQNIRKVNAPEIAVEMKSIRALSISGSGEIKGENRINSKNIDMSISGSGDMLLELKTEQVETKVSGSGEMSLELEARTVRTNISGSGDIEMSGKAESLETKISGSGSLSAHDLETRSVSIRISGSGSCTVYATDELEVDISGSGNVEYRGQPKVNLSGSGSGSVRSK